MHLIKVLLITFARAAGLVLVSSTVLLAQVRIRVDLILFVYNFCKTINRCR